MVVYFIAFQAFLLLVAIVLLLWQKTWYTHTNTWASIVTVVGVFGTFLGIFIGLLGFQPDPDKIQESIKVLLGGLKLAFLTSLFGILSAIILKGWALYYQMRNAGEDPSIKAIAKTDDILNSIKTSVESGNTQLMEAFGSISDEIAEKGSHVLVDALKGVVRDYNARINEQFGENFVKFNEAVIEINRWQKQYRHQMDELANEFHIAAESVEKSRAALASSAESLKTIEDQSETLVAIAATLDPLLGNLNQQLDTFRQLRQQALDAFPQISERLDVLATEFTSSVGKAINDSQESMNRQKTAFTTQVGEIQKTVQTVTRELSEITVSFSQTNEDLRKTIVEVPGVLTQIDHVLEQIDDGLQGTFKQSTQIDGLIDSLRRRIAGLETTSRGFRERFRRNSPSEKT